MILDDDEKSYEKERDSKRYEDDSIISTHVSRDEKWEVSHKNDLLRTLTLTLTFFLAQFPSLLLFSQSALSFLLFLIQLKFFF